MASGLSLANKCQLLFGVAVVVLLAGVLAVPWFRSVSLVEDAQLEIVRQLADTQLGSLDSSSTTRTVTPAEARVSSKLFLRTALENFESDPELSEQFEQTDVGGDPRILYVRAVRNEGEVVAMVLVDRPGAFGAGQLLTSRIFIIAAGIFAGLIAILVFYLILTKLIFSPVRALRETTELVERGDLDARSQIKTGDDFEQLSRAFNRMLDELGRSQSRLTSMNESLDLKVTELAEANIGLFESNRLKSEFLANISHELKTPLNSIIGFAELLSGGMDGDDSKQSRYVSNILTSGRSLLELINDLLDMAKIEAGRMDVNVEPTNIRDLIDGLVNIMTPQASNKSIRLQTEFDPKLSEIHTDPGKLQQILYNFLSNAIKFTPQDGTILLRGDCIAEDTPKLRLSVIDSGPGISADMQDVIFEKFRQADASHTREFTGTGLGLAICRELADLLNAEVSLVSSLGNGSTFSVTIPTDYMPREAPSLMGQPPVS